MREEGYYWIIPKRDNYNGRPGWQIACWLPESKVFWTDEQDGCDFEESDCERIYQSRILTPDEIDATEPNKGQMSASNLIKLDVEGPKFTQSPSTNLNESCGS